MGLVPIHVSDIYACHCRDTVTGHYKTTETVSLTVTLLKADHYPKQSPFNS